MPQLPRLLRTFFLVCTLMGIVISVVDMLYSANFGLTISNVTGLGLAALSIGSSCLAVLVVAFWRLGFRRFAQGMACVLAAVFCFNVISNMGVATSNRLVDVQKANVKKAVHAERDKSKADAERRLAIFEKQLATLIEKDAWAATVTASGLRDKLSLLERNRASEAALGGCGPKCRKIENEMAAVQGKIAVAEQREGLDERIAATKRVLDQARSTLETTDTGISSTANQASLYSRWTVGWFTDGESVGAIRNSNEVMGIFMALIIALASAGLNLAGAWPALMSIQPIAMSLSGRHPDSTGGPASPLGSEAATVRPVASLPTPPAPRAESVAPVAAAAPYEPVRHVQPTAVPAIPQQTVQVGLLDDRGAQDLVKNLRAKIHEAIRDQQPVAA